MGRRRLGGFYWCVICSSHSNNDFFNLLYSVSDSIVFLRIPEDKHNSARILQELSDQISTMHKTLNQYLLSCKERRLKLTKDGYSCKR